MNTELIQLTPRAIGVLKDDANEHHRLCVSSAQTGLEHAVKAGQALEKLKGAVAHGEWLPWLKANFDGSIRAAQIYMRLSQRVPAMEAIAANAQPVALLGVKSALAAFAEPRDGVTPTPKPPADAPAPELAEDHDNEDHDNEDHDNEDHDNEDHDNEDHDNEDHDNEDHDNEDHDNEDHDNGFEPEIRQGKLPVGTTLANEALNVLARIPKDDALRKRGFRIVTDWIWHNDEPDDEDRKPSIAECPGGNKQYIYTEAFADETAKYVIAELRRIPKRSKYRTAAFRKAIDWATEILPTAGLPTADGFELHVANAKLENAVTAQATTWPAEHRVEAAATLRRLAAELEG